MFQEALDSEVDSAKNTLQSILYYTKSCYTMILSCFSDEETGNPMVAGFQDDLDSEDDVAARAPVTIATDDIDISSDEDEKQETPVPQIHIAQDEDYEFEKVDMPKEKIDLPKSDKKRERSRSPKLKPDKENKDESDNTSKELYNGHKDSNDGKVSTKEAAKDKTRDTVKDVAVKDTVKSTIETSKADRNMDKNKEKRKPQPVVDSEESGEDEDDDGGVQVLQDIEDISEDDMDGSGDTAVQPTVQQDAEDMEDEVSGFILKNLYVYKCFGLYISFGDWR